MITLSEVTRHIRSKNAGPFWVTIDIFFTTTEHFNRYVDHDALGIASIAQLFGADEKRIKRFPVASLNVLKISYPRATSQGGEVERDLHSGQQYVRLLALELV